jgi:hypothetical protein
MPVLEEALEKKKSLLFSSDSFLGHIFQYILDYFLSIMILPKFFIIIESNHLARWKMLKLQLKIHDEILLLTLIHLFSNVLRIRDKKDTGY